MEDDLPWKTTSHGESGISPQPLTGSYSNLKLKLRWPNYILQIFSMMTTSYGRRPQNIKVEYLSNHWSDLFQNLNLYLGDQSKEFKYSKCRRPPMEDNLPWKTTFRGRRPPMEDNLQWKTTPQGRQPQNIESGISQQPLTESYSNSKLKLR
jgi:hypothetical protein